MGLEVESKERSRVAMSVEFVVVGSVGTKLDW